MKLLHAKFLPAFFAACLLAFPTDAGLANDRASSISFYEAELSLEKVSGYDVIKLPGTHLMGKVGEPALPVKNVYIALPEDAQVTAVELASFEVAAIPGSYRIYPAQPPVPAKKDAKAGPFVQPKASIYDSRQPYPRDIVNYVGTASLGGQKIAMLQVFPVQYLPSGGVLKLYEQIEFRLVTKSIDRPPPWPHRSRTAQLIYDKIYRDLVINPQDIGKDAEYPLPPANLLEYLIVTGDEFVSSFQPLAEWKTQGGIPAAIRTTSWIDANYSGADLQEKIRNYLKIAHHDSGTVWALLGGDTWVVPCRYARIELETFDEDIPCDLYYSDLDGNWNYDGDSWFGEPEDSLDLLPDIFVGRAPANSIQEAQRFVSKVLTYTVTPALGYQTKGLFFAEYMDAQTDQGIAKDIIMDRYIPEGFGPVVKLYESLGNLNATAVVSSLNGGINIANHCGHAWYDVLCTGPDNLYYSSFDNLSNAPKYTGVLVSGGCWPAAIDYGCIGEHFVNAPNGGGFFIGNSRYGWFSPSFPGYGSSDLFDQAFFSEVFVNGEPRLGAALAASKILYAADAQAVNDYRWLCFALTLLGDPEMALWTDDPGTLTSHHADTVVVGQSEFLVSVSSGNQPVQDALVCVRKGEEVYQTGLSGPDGQVHLSIVPPTAGTLYVSATAANFLPHESYSIAVTDRPQITPLGYLINDDLGSSDGIVNPGERIVLSLHLANVGTQSAYAVVGSLSTSSPLVDAIVDDLADYGDIASGETASGEFGFDVSSGAADRDVILFDLDVTATGGFTWDPRIAVTVGTPVLSYFTSSIDDGPGGDGFADPNDTVSLSVTIRNEGLGNGEGVYGILDSNDPHVQILSDSSWFGQLGAEALANSTLPYQLTIQGACPSQHLARLSLTLTGENYSGVDSFLLPIGDISFFDDVESGEDGWVHSGTIDEWHISAHRSYSGSHSWYCGNEGTWQYSNGFTAYLTSPPVMIAEEAVLNFRTWYYIESGWDYAFCEINPGDGWRELGMMTGQSGDWVEKTYDLSEFGGDTVQIRFSFLSDYDWAQFEGWYVDDVEIVPYNPEFIRGDCNRDGTVGPGDVVYLINYLFRNGPEPVPLQAGDCNCDGSVGPGDVVYLINYLFRNGSRPGCP